MSACFTLLTQYATAIKDTCYACLLHQHKVPDMNIVLIVFRDSQYRIPSSNNSNFNFIKIHLQVPL